MTAAALASLPLVLVVLAAPLERLAGLVDNEYIRTLDVDPEFEAHQPNRAARAVHSGHFVPVKPTELPAPELVLASKEVCEDLLQLDGATCGSDDFVRIFSGADLSDRLPGFGTSWATPYALSIYGSEIIPNGAGPDGNGYGDGRAISIAEVALPPPLAFPPAAAATTSPPMPPMPQMVSRLEIQLKGAGKTPFCRNADGRAVLRSSTREFLASEAMHALGVPTTRALCLVASRVERASRPWYRNLSSAIALGMVTTPQRHGGDVMREERCAITTRVARSFVRVGQIELYGRRARRGDPLGFAQLERLVRHVARREYPNETAADALQGEGGDGGGRLGALVLAMAAAAARRFATLAAEWVRVGYVQSNFNSDNCLVGGATVDYGPFGFLERFDPGWAMWIGGGQHFSFLNQPKAAGANLRQLLHSLEPLLVDDDGDAAARDLERLRRIGRSFDALAEDALNRVWARKLGLPTDGARSLERAAQLWTGCRRLLASHPTDYTIFWRQLADVATAIEDASAATDEALLAPLIPIAFYKPLHEATRREWARWLRWWLTELNAVHGARPETRHSIAEGMRRASPKYIPREWMLAEAYEAAERGDYAAVRTLHDVLRRPYDEQPEVASRFFQRAPDGSDVQGGIGFMS